MPADLSEITIGPYESGDEHQILAAFKKVFDVERPLEVWNWEYRDNPAGIHCFLAKLPDGKVVAQFTGIPRRMKWGERTVCFSEIVDSLTDPEHRKGLKKPGLFATTCYRFVDHYGHPDGEIVMYGLPNPPAFRVGRALLGYTWLYEIEFLSREFPSAPPPSDDLLGGFGSVRIVERFGEDADRLQEEAGSRHAIMTIRDATYLNWRYADRPDVDYELVEFRDLDGSLFGLATLHHAWRGLPVTLLGEWLVDPAHPGARGSLAWLEARAFERECTQLKLLARPHSPEWHALRDFSYTPEPTQFTFVARTYDREKLTIRDLQTRWYVSAGDFDIV